MRKGLKSFEEMDDYLTAEMEREEAQKENRQLAKGIFWIIDGKLVCCLIQCSSNGDPLGELVEDAVSKSGTNYNHERYWATLPKSVTGGKDYQYYPRGRVEIARGRAKIYLNPQICSDEVRKMIVEEFGLSGMNVDMMADGAAHYHCFLDN